MTKQDFRKRVISLLRGIINQRTWLIKHDKSYIESDWAQQEIRNITYAAKKLVDADRAKAYLERKETALRYLIPAKNRKWHDELRELINTQLN
jgi:hypothetical protein